MTVYKQSQESIIKILKNMTGKYNLYALWRDFLTIAACTISNSVDKSQWEQREEMYMKTIEKYDEEEANRFAEIIALIVTGLNGGEFGDFLGEIYMQLEITNKDIGQFFTPYNVSKLSAELAGVHLTDNVMSLNEPSCGSGGMIIAYAEAMKNQGFNYQEKLRVICNDLDYDVVKMAYIQLSLLGIDAVIMQGNTLTLEISETWYTPMYFVNIKRDRERKENEKLHRMINIVKDLERKSEKTLLRKAVMETKEDLSFMFYFL